MAGEKDTDTAKDDVIITTGMFDENLFYNYVYNKAQNTFSLSCNEMFAWSYAYLFHILFAYERHTTCSSFEPKIAITWWFINHIYL